MAAQSLLATIYQGVSYLYMCDLWSLLRNSVTPKAPDLKSISQHLAEFRIDKPYFLFSMMTIFHLHSPLFAGKV